MKSIFVIAIFFTLLPFNFANSKSPWSSNSDFKKYKFFEQEIPEMLQKKCYGLEEAASLFGIESDLIVEFHEKWKNRIIVCQNEQPGNELAAKQLAFITAWIEMPEKLKKTEETLDKMEEEKNNLTVAFDKMTEEHKNLTVAFVEVNEGKKTWKVLAIVFIGVAIALLLFIIAACAYIYQLGRK